MAAIKWAAAKFRVIALVNGNSIQDVIEVNINWELNTIPLATLVLGVGRNLATGQPAKIHQLYGTFTNEMPVEIYFQAVSLGTLNLPDLWAPAAAPIQIFDGYITGMGWQKAGGQLQFVMSLRHWLADLDNSIAISGAMHAGSPADLTWSAISPIQRMGSPKAANVSAFTPMGPYIGVNSGANAVTADLWGNVLYPWLTGIASMGDPISDTLRPGVITTPSNRSAVEALARMAPGIGGPDSVALALNTTGADDTSILANNISNALGRETYGSWVAVTLWGKLINEWAGGFRFAVVPRVADTLVVPEPLPYQGGAFVDVTDDDYSHVAIKSGLPRVLRALGIVHGVAQAAGGIPFNHVSASKLAAIYPPFPATDGVIMLKHGPAWLLDSLQEYAYTALATGAKRPIPTAIDGGPAVVADAPPVIPNPNTSFLQRLAQQWYAAEILSARYGEFSGRLRFDIAPGSQISLQTAGERFIGVDALAQTLYATVIRVSCSIKSDTPDATTSFALANVRTLAENTSENTSVKQSPLYNMPWLGAPLLPEFRGL